MVLDGAGADAGGDGDGGGGDDGDDGDSGGNAHMMHDGARWCMLMHDGAC